MIGVDGNDEMHDYLEEWVILLEKRGRRRDEWERERWWKMEREREMNEWKDIELKQLVWLVEIVCVCVQLSTVDLVNQSALIEQAQFMLISRKIGCNDKIGRLARMR